VFFFAVLAATGRRWGAAMARPPCVLFGSACCNREKMGAAMARPPCVLFGSACCNRKKMGGRDGPPPLCSFWQCLLQQEEDGGPRWPAPLVFFLAVLAATGRRWGAAMARPPCVLFGSACCNRKKMGARDGPPPLCSFWQCLLQQEEDGGPRWPAPLVFFFAVFAATARRWGAAMSPLVFFFECLLRGALNTPLTRFVWRWFRLSFCAPFLALHSSARNHATRFSMFFSSSKPFYCFFSPTVLGPHFELQAYYQPLRREVYFYSLLQIQSEKGQKFNNPAAEQRSSPQGCTVRAKAASDKAR